MNFFASAPQDSAIKLILEPRTYVAGERLVGIVELDLKKAHEDEIELVRVKLRGVASTRIHRNQNGSSSTGRRSRGNISRASMVLIRLDVVLWQRGAYPADARVIQIPFEFDLPAKLPGSFQSQSGASRHSGTISYGIEAVADRPGLLRFNRRSKDMFPLLPAASEEQALCASQLAESWTGAWTSTEKASVIRKGIWGEYSRVKAQFHCPALQSFPVGVSLPVSLVITTITKPMTRSEAAPDTLSAESSTPLFPAPPSGAPSVRVQLLRQVHLEADSAQTTVEEHLAHLGGFGMSTNEARRFVRTTHEEPVWIPDTGDVKSTDTKGRWKREVRFDTVIKLNCSPTTNIGIIRVKYELAIEVPFPGLTNNLTWRIPIHVNSGVGRFDPNVPPPALDLPPSYFSGQDQLDGEESVMTKLG